MSLNEDSEQQVAKVALRIPQFWKANVRLWIAQCDNAFTYSGITSDETKFSALIANIDAETLTHVSDIVLNPPISEKYKALSERLISEFEDSEHQKIKKLLTELQLGDERPSHLLRKMKQLSGTQLTDDFLQNLWMQRMPAHIQTVLSASSEKLDQLAIIADKVAEVVQPSAICATSRAGTSLERSDITTATLAKQVEELTRQVAELSRERKVPKFRGRSSSRPRNGNYSSSVCFYHNRFGDKARKCTKPCTYVQQKNPSPLS